MRGPTQLRLRLRATDERACASLDAAMEVPATIAADRLAAEVAGAAWGVLSVGELRGCGLSRSAIRTRAANGRLHRLHEGVYAVGHPCPPLEGRFLAAVKACGPQAALSHFSAAALWDLVDWEDRRIEVTVVGTAIRKHPGLWVHRTLRRAPQDWVMRSGIAVTSVERTLIDLAAILPAPALRRAVRRAFSLKRTGLRPLAEAVSRAGRRRGIAAIRVLLADGYVPTVSELEDVVLDLFDRGGLERPKVNEPLILNGRRVVPDFRWPEQRLVVEADGAAWHDDPLARADDAERQALLEAHGERVVRVTWQQAVSQSAQTLSRVLSAGAPRLRLSPGGG